jgi:hypothetical protein
MQWFFMIGEMVPPMLKSFSLSEAHHVGVG